MAAKSLNDMAPPTSADLERLAEGAAREPDYSDIPSISLQAIRDGAVASRQRRNPNARKTHVTLELDDEVIESFRAMGEDFQPKINEALRIYLYYYRRQNGASVS